MAFSEVVTYDTAASLSFDATLVHVSAGALSLLNVPPYTTTNPRVTSQHQNTISGLSGFTESSTLPASTAIQYQLILSGNPFWYNATDAKWESSDGTYTQSNTAAVINSHASALFTDLSLLTNQFLGLAIFLHTSNTANTPILTSNTITYTWANSNASAINQCLITGYLSNLVGANPIPTTAQPTQFLVTAPYGFFHGNHFVQPFTKTFSFDNTGYLSASVIETATPGVQLEFLITYWDGNSVKTSKLFNAITPNQAQVDISNLSAVYPYDFG